MVYSQWKAVRNSAWCRFEAIGLSYPSRRRAAALPETSLNSIAISEDASTKATFIRRARPGNGPGRLVDRPTPKEACAGPDCTLTLRSFPILRAGLVPRTQIAEQGESPPPVCPDMRRLHFALHARVDATLRHTHWRHMSKNSIPNHRNN